MKDLTPYIKLLLTLLFSEELHNINNVILYDSIEKAILILHVSFNIRGLDTSELSYLLDSDYNIVGLGFIVLLSP